jgi:hypothetical protein
LAEQGPTWSAFSQDVRATLKRVRNTHRVFLDSEGLKGRLRNCVQGYFRQSRPELLSLGVPESKMEPVDACMQQALRLVSARSRVAAFNRLWDELDTLLTDVEIQLELAIGRRSPAGSPGFLQTGLEAAIISTLSEMLPESANSYAQALADLGDVNRRSYRGTAAELRETVREVLDHFAPDDEVTHSPGFRLEPGLLRPTMRQKARFILKARRRPSGSMNVPMEAIDLLEERAASVARATYERGSTATHLASTREDVMELKPYVDSVLSELLELHRVNGKGTPRRASL